MAEGPLEKLGQHQNCHGSLGIGYLFNSCCLCSFMLILFAFHPQFERKKLKSNLYTKHLCSLYSMYPRRNPHVRVHAS